MATGSNPLDMQVAAVPQATATALAIAGPSANVAVSSGTVPALRPTVTAVTARVATLAGAGQNLAARVRGLVRGQVILALEGIDADKHPEVNYSVFLNLPPGAPPDPKSIYYVGRLSFFARISADMRMPGMQHRGMGDNPDTGSSQAYDITGIVQKQMAANIWVGGDFTVTLVPAGVVLANGTRTRGIAGSNARITRVRILQG
jgi:hypothetical protein